MWTEFSLHLLSYWGAVWFFDRVILPVAALTSLYNQFTITLPLMYLFEDLYSHTVDSIGVSLAKLTGVFLLSNVLFYSTHRLLHTPTLYRHIHSVHHEFTEPVGVCALYAHPVEHLLANNLCFVLPVVIFRLNYYWMLTMLCISSWNIVWAHAKVDSARSHRLHHLLYNVNYGFLDVLDVVLGTTVAHTALGDACLNDRVSTNAKESQAM